MAFMSVNPYKIVEMFEQALAEYSGSKYCVCVESCTSAILLSLLWVSVKGYSVSIPKRTYPGVAASIIHAGGKLEFDDRNWQGVYSLDPFAIIDGALRFRKGMYIKETFHCLSFHGKKLLPIGRGGAILTDDKDAYEWFKLMRFDGRRPVPLQEDTISLVGYNCYLQPEQAARGLQLMQAMGDKELPDLSVESQKYSDLSKQPAYAT
jgi:dTDP-4-amino-4,6-dideoxygalactose transaminase